MGEEEGAGVYITERCNVKKSILKGEIYQISIHILTSLPNINNLLGMQMDFSLWGPRREQEST